MSAAHKGNDDTNSVVDIWTHFHCIRCGKVVEWKNGCRIQADSDTNWFEYGPICSCCFKDYEDGKIELKTGR